VSEIRWTELGIGSNGKLERKCRQSEDRMGE
jgi:hypothetical protein